MANGLDFESLKNATEQKRAFYAQGSALSAIEPEKPELDFYNLKMETLSAVSDRFVSDIYDKLLRPEESKTTLRIGDTVYPGVSSPESLAAAKRVVAGLPPTPRPTDIFDRMMPKPVGLLEIADPKDVSVGLPFVGEKPSTGFVESVKEEFTRPARGFQYIPISGGAVGTQESLVYLAAHHRLKQKDYDYSKPIREEPTAVPGVISARPLKIYSSRVEDQKMIEELIVRMEKQSRGYTFGGKVAKGLLNLPTWMAEFAMTGGLANLGSTAAKNAGTKLIGRWAKTKAGQIALRGAGWTGGAITRTTLGLTPRVAEQTLKRQVDVQVLGIKDEGWAMSVAKAWGSVIIEAASEEAGGTITKGLLAGVGKVPFGSKFLTALRKSWMGISPDNSMMRFYQNILRKGGYSNIIGEVGEERLATILHAIAKTEDFGTGKDASVIDRLKAGLKQDITEFPVEAVVLSAPGATRVALAQAAGILERPTRPAEPTPTAEVSPEKRTQAISYVKDVLSQEQYTNLDEKTKIEIGQRMLAEYGIDVSAEELIELVAKMPTEKIEPEGFVLPTPTEEAVPSYIEKEKRLEGMTIRELRQLTSETKDPELQRLVHRRLRELQQAEGVTKPSVKAPKVDIKTISDSELKERLLSTQPATPEWTEAFKETKRRKAERVAKAEVPPTVPKLAPEKPTEAITKPEAVEEKPREGKVTIVKGKPEIFQIRSGEEGKVQDVKGTKVVAEKYPELELFVHKGLEGGWDVTEKSSGTRITSTRRSPTRQNAIEEAERILSKAPPAKIEKAIKATTEKFGTIGEVKPPDEVSEAAVPKAKTYEGQAFRVETGLVIKGETAADVVRYEQEELGNDLGVSPEKITALESVSSDKVVWVARDEETAKGYVPEGEIPDVQDYTDIVKGGEVLAEIPDGVLVIKPSAPPPIRPEEIVAEPKVVEPKKPKVEIGTVDDINVVGLADKISEKLKTSIEPVDNRQVKKWVADAYEVSQDELTPEKGYSHKKVQEAVELALVNQARDIVEENRGDSEKTFNALVESYDNQPVLTSRTGTSITEQAYSTPSPLAFLASELAHIDKETVVYEPTAGTGMLTIAAEPANVVVNEIDPTRAEILRSQGYANVTQIDARKADLAPLSDVVIMNPPFGKHEEVKFGKYPLTHIEHIIAAENLKAMRDGGRAVMIIAAPKKMGKYSIPDWVFGNYIYSNYSVIGDFEVEGDLYRRQGAGWPVRVIVIHGRKKSEKYAPKVGNFRAKSWSEAYNKSKEILENEPDIIYPITRAERGRIEAVGRGVKERPAEGLQAVREPVTEPTIPISERPSVEVSVSRGIAEGELGRRGPERRLGVGDVPVGQREVLAEPSRIAEPSVSERRAEAEERVIAERRERPAVSEAERQREISRIEKRKPMGMVGATALGKLQVKYKPSSQAPALNENIPTYLEPHVTSALKKLKQNVGDIDAYVREQLQYKSNNEMWEHLSATQVDSVALALDRIDKRSALIVGHQTGVGKGRVGAALVRREILNGRKPVFFTSGKHLFTDFFRDLFDIGLTEDQLKPLMVNADVDIKDQKNKVIFKKHGSRQNADKAIYKALSDKDYNLVLSTYHQVNTETRKQRAQIAELTKDQILILDESHNAAGESQTGEYIKELLIPRSSGVLFSSATYAKTPKTMTLYARTGLLDAFDGDRDNMLESVKAGGEPYQEVIAAALARANSYIRTELDFSGVKYETTIDARHIERDTERADKTTEVFRKIIAFDEQFSKEFIDPKKKNAKAQAKRTKSVGTTVGHTNFAAVAHNAIKQMLLALKIDETVSQVKQALKAGKRPIVALENTMGSFLDRYVKQRGLDAGDTIEDFDYREVMLSMLRNTLRYQEVSGFGDVRVIYVKLEDLSLGLQDVYREAENHIKKMTLDLPGSPIDEIISSLEAEGYKVGEVTGRDKKLIKKGKNRYELAIRSSAERDKTSVVYDYNFGDTEVLIVNVAGAEGVSAHASKNFKNKEQRAMIVVQPAADINKFVQILGRVNRKGQVVEPEYNVLMTGLPAELRPAAILENKMRSLNANTSAKTKGAYEQKGIPDILNIYGEYIIAQYVVQNPDILRQMGLDIDVSSYQESIGTGNYHGIWNEDKLARRFTGRLALLSVEQQQEFYDWAEPEFENLIEYLTKTDQNELVSTDKDFKAKEVSTKTIFIGEPGNVFQEPAMLDKMSVVLEGRPMTTDEIKDEARRVAEKENVSPNVYMGTVSEKVNKAWLDYQAGLKRKGKKLRKNTAEAYNRTKAMLSRIKLGSVRQDNEGSPFVLLEIIDTFSKKEYTFNPTAPSSVRLRIAIPHPARSAIISLSQFENSQRYYGSIDKYFNIPTDQKEERYIANGNIIAAMGVVVGDSEKSNKQIRPKVINYTMADGERRQGLLLPKNYDPSHDLPTSVNMIPEAAVPYLMDNPKGLTYLKVGEARIYKVDKNKVYIEVPKSKARGLKYFGDARLKEITGEFETYRQAMRADFKADKLLDALVYLKSRGNSIKSDDSFPDMAREYNNAHRDKPEGDIGFPAEQQVPRKLPLRREAGMTEYISQRDIVQYLSNALGVPIKGVATFRKKKPGWYNKRTRGIRLKNVNSLRVATHEIGHFIDIYFNDSFSKSKFFEWYGLSGEMVRLGKAAYGKKRPTGGYKMEGYAEFVFGWLTGAINLEKEAPLTLSFFENKYLKDNADMKDILYTARDMIGQWKEQGAEARFDSQIAQKLKPIKGIWERFSLWWSTAWADSSAPLQRALQENLPERTIERGSEDPGFLFGFLTQTEGARAKTFVMNHTIDMWGNPTGKSLKEVLRPVADEIKDFIRYVVAARAINLDSRELESGFDTEDALYIYKKYNSPKWEKVAQELTEWNYRLLDYLVEAGGLEKESVIRMRELNPIYVPFLRTFAPDEKRRTPKGVGRGLIRRGKGVYKIKGSGRGIEDPLESMITQTRRFISIAHKSAIARALAQVEQKTEGLAGLIERVPPPMQATTFDAKQLKKQLIDLGIDIVPGDLDDAMLTVFGNSPVFLGKEHIISIIVDGKRQWYEVAPELYRVLEGADQFVLPKILNVTFGKAARAVRLGATGVNASFGLVRNPIRDILDTTVKAQYARGPVAFAKGVGKDLSNTGLAKSLGIDANKAAEKYADIGGQISGFFGQDRTGTQHLKGDMLAHTVTGHAIRTARHPVTATRALFGIPETGLRIEEYERALADWMKRHQPEGGEAPPDAIVYAFEMASDQTINYRRSGEYGKWLNSMIPFWNANAQDISKVYRTFRDRPQEAIMWGVAVLTLPAIGLWYMHKDDEWYKELPIWEKANNIHIPIFKMVKRVPLLGRFVTKYEQGDEIDYILRLPVPFIIGHIFQSMPVAALDTLYTQDPKKITEFLYETFKANLKPLFDWPAALKPYLDIRRNKDWAERPIIPRSVEGRLPEDQYAPYTTKFAKIIGKIFNQSPAQIEYALNSYSGGLYRRAAKTGELVWGRKRELVPRDWPMIGTLFTRDPYAPKKSIEDFYKEKDRLDRMYQSRKLPVRLRPKRGRYNRVATYLTQTWRQLSKAKTVNERKIIYKRMTNLLKKAKPNG